ncbi:MAG: hypothetical protein NTV32_04630 [Gammaproteobacteria bacterium]|nr:hypothetical protein [Gammaproteobacteria bacterium]
MHGEVGPKKSDDSEATARDKAWDLHKLSNRLENAGADLYDTALDEFHEVSERFDPENSDHVRRATALLELQQLRGEEPCYEMHVRGDHPDAYHLHQVKFELIAGEAGKSLKYSVSRDLFGQTIPDTFKFVRKTWPLADGQKVSVRYTAIQTNNHHLLVYLDSIAVGGRHAGASTASTGALLQFFQKLRGQAKKKGMHKIFIQFDPVNERLGEILTKRYITHGYMPMIVIGPAPKSVAQQGIFLFDEHFQEMVDEPVIELDVTAPALKSKPTRQAAGIAKDPDAEYVESLEDSRAESAEALKERAQDFCERLEVKMTSNRYHAGEEYMNFIQQEQFAFELVRQQAEARGWDLASSEGVLEAGHDLQQAMKAIKHAADEAAQTLEEYVQEKSTQRAHEIRAVEIQAQALQAYAEALKKGAHLPSFKSGALAPSVATEPVALPPKKSMSARIHQEAYSEPLPNPAFQKDHVKAVELAQRLERGGFLSDDRRMQAETTLLDLVEKHGGESARARAQTYLPRQHTTMDAMREIGFGVRRAAVGLAPGFLGGAAGQGARWLAEQTGASELGADKAEASIGVGVSHLVAKSLKFTPVGLAFNAGLMTTAYAGDFLGKREASLLDATLPESHPTNASRKGLIGLAQTVHDVFSIPVAAAKGAIGGAAGWWADHSGRGPSLTRRVFSSAATETAGPLQSLLQHGKKAVDGIARAHGLDEFQPWKPDAEDGVSKSSVPFSFFTSPAATAELDPTEEVRPMSFSYRATAENEAEVDIIVEDLEKLYGQKYTSAQRAEVRSNAQKLVYDPGSETAQELRPIVELARKAAEAEFVRPDLAPKPVSKPAASRPQARPPVARAPEPPRVDRAAADVATTHLNQSIFAQCLPSNLTPAQRAEILRSNDPKSQAEAYGRIYWTEMSPEQRAQANAEINKNLHERTDVPKMHDGAAVDSNGQDTVQAGANHLYGVTYAGAAIFSAMGKPKLAGGLTQVGAGAMAFSSGYTAIATSGASAGPVGLVIGGIVMVGMGIHSALSDEEAAGSGLSEALKQIQENIAALFKQIEVLGKHIDLRFDRLEKILGEQHHEVLQFLNRLVFDHALSVADIKALMREYHGDLSQDLKKLDARVQEVLSEQMRGVEVRIADRYAQMKEFHFLQTQPDRRLVNQARIAMTRPAELAEAFVPQSRTLMQAITMESRGSDSLTGKDLPVDFAALTPPQLELLRTRLLTPCGDRDPTLETLRVVAAYHIDALVQFGQMHGAVPDAVGRFSFPNLHLLKERVAAFLDFHKAYAAQVMPLDDDAKAPIPESALQDLTDVMAYLRTVSEHLRQIDARAVLGAALDGLKKHYTEMYNLTVTALHRFEEKKSKEMLERQQARLDRETALTGQLAHRETFTIPEENQVCRYQIYVCPAIKYANDFVEPQNLLTFVSPFQMGSIPLHDLYGRRGYATTAEGLHTGLRAPYGDGSCLPVQSFSYASCDRAELKRKHQTQWGPRYHTSGQAADAFSHFPTYPEEEMRLDGEAQTRKNTAQLKAYVTLGQSIQQAIDDDQSFDLFDVKYLQNFSGMPQTLGPRLVMPMPGQPLGFCLSLHHKGFDRFIPPDTYFAEAAGLGEIVLQFSAKMVAVSGAKAVTLGLTISFVSKDKRVQETLFNASETRNVAPAYTNLKEVVTRMWEGASLFDPEQVNLSCDLFDHYNPYFKRVTKPALAVVFAAKPVDPARLTAATASIKKLVEEQMVAWRCEFNQDILATLQHWRGPLGEACIKAEAMSVMIGCLVALLLPDHHAHIEGAINDLHHRCDLIDFVKSLDGRDNYALPHIIKPPRTERAVFCLADRLQFILRDGFGYFKTDILAEVDRVLIPGDTELDALLRELEVHAETLELAVPTVAARHVPPVEEDGYATDPDDTDIIQLTADFIEDGHDLTDEDQGRWFKPVPATHPSLTPFCKAGMRVFAGEFANPRDRVAFLKHLRANGYVSAKGHKVFEGQPPVSVVELETMAVHI